MSILIWILFGGFVGWIASMVMRSSNGLLWDVVIGIVGAVIGGFIMTSLGQSGVGGFNLYSLLVAVLGACVLIAIVRAVRK